MKALIEKLQTATEPDRQLDFEIERHLPFKSTATPHYTSSIDAALTLVPSKPWIWSVWDAEGSFSATVCISGGGWVEDHPEYRNHSTGRTPAIALCIAALKARATATTETLKNRQNV